MTNTTVLKGANIHRFSLNQDAVLLVQRRMGKFKDPGMKEVGQTVSDKARIAIPIDLMMMYQEENDEEEIYY